MTATSTDLLLGGHDRPALDADELSRDLLLHEMPGYLVRRLHSKATALYEAHTGQTGLTPRQFGLLQVVGSAGVIKQSDLAAALHLDRSTLGEMLPRMIDRGLLARRPVADDRRTSALELTDSGRAVLLSTVSGAVDAQVALLAPLPAYLRPVFLHCLAVLVEDDVDTTTRTGDERT